jgi:hypothetical protein
LQEIEGYDHCDTYSADETSLFSIYNIAKHSLFRDIYSMAV